MPQCHVLTMSPTTLLVLTDELPRRWYSPLKIYMKTKCGECDLLFTCRRKWPIMTKIKNTFWRHFKEACTYRSEESNESCSYELMFTVRLSVGVQWRYLKSNASGMQKWVSHYNHQVSLDLSSNIFLLIFETFSTVESAIDWDMVDSGNSLPWKLHWKLLVDPSILFHSMVHSNTALQLHLFYRELDYHRPLQPPWDLQN